MLLDDALEYTSTSTGTLVNAARRGQIGGALVYAADGSRDVPGLRWAFPRAGLDLLILRNTSLSPTGVAAATRLGRKAVPRLIKARLLTPDKLANDARTFLHRSQVTDVLERLLLSVSSQPGPELRAAEHQRQSAPPQLSGWSPRDH